MPELAVTAIGADRPGIVARVTGVLLDHGGNLLDASAAILGGQFAMMLLVTTPQDALTLQRALTAATSDLGLVISVSQTGAGTVSSPPTHVLSVYGADRPGILHAVAQTLAHHEVNVTDLKTRVLAGERPVYAVVVEVALPAGLAAGELAGALRQSAALSGISSSLQPLDTGLL